jgi:hypothetical protein
LPFCDGRQRVGHIAAGGTGAELGDVRHRQRLIAGGSDRWHRCANFSTRVAGSIGHDERRQFGCDYGRIALCSDRCCRFVSTTGPAFTGASTYAHQGRRTALK